MPSSVNSCECEPDSTTRPSSRTMMRSAFITLDRRWAIMSVVRPSMSLSSASWIMYSFSASTADSASSSIRIGASRNNARAIATRCRCPPDRRMPRSPITVPYPSGRAEMNPCALAALAASSSSFGVASGLPNFKLSDTVPWNRYVSWLTTASLLRI